MNKLELNDSHCLVLSKILNDVCDYETCYAEQTSDNKLRIGVATNILCQLNDQKQAEPCTPEMLNLSMDVRMDTVEHNIKYMVDNEINRNSDRIDVLESLVDDLTTVFNKHSICGDE